MPRKPEPKKATFDLPPQVARKLADLKNDLQYDEGLRASEASGLAIVSALILSATPDRVAELLKKNRKRR